MNVSYFKDTKLTRPSAELRKLVKLEELRTKAEGYSQRTNVSY